MRVPQTAAWVGGVLLLTGLATRYIAAVLFFELFACAMIDPRVTDSIYLLMSRHVKRPSEPKPVLGKGLIVLASRRR